MSSVAPQFYNSDLHFRLSLERFRGTQGLIPMTMNGKGGGKWRLSKDWRLRGARRGVDDGGLFLATYSVEVIENLAGHLEIVTTRFAHNAATRGKT